MFHDFIQFKICRHINRLQGTIGDGEEEKSERVEEKSGYKYIFT